MTERENGREGMGREEWEVNGRRGKGDEGKGREENGWEVKRKEGK